MTTSLPPTRTTTPSQPSRYNTPPPPPSKAIPTDFKSSLSAWWSNSSYKEARYAEDRLLRRLAMFEPPSAPPPSKGWFGWSGAEPTTTVPPLESRLDAIGREIGDARAGDEVVHPLPVTGTGLVATLRNVFIPTPDPALAPAHPADLVTPSPAGSASSSSSSLSNSEKKHRQAHHHSHKSKHEDYINTLEISNAENATSREAVVVMHGYAAALGYVMSGPVPPAWPFIDGYNQTGSSSGTGSPSQ